jgi:hypothetical protein
LTIEARKIGQKSHIIYNKFNTLPLWYRLCLTLNQVQGLFFKVRGKENQIGNDAKIP